ncbi:MAG: hypothetical protein ACE5HX_07505 [bacterium]
MKPKIVNPCLKAEEIERYVLKKEWYNKTQELNILKHFNYCNKCCKYYFEMEMFHQILDTELMKPISKEVINLVEELQSNQIIE